MWRWIVGALGGLVVVGLVLWAVLVVSMRTGFDPVLSAIRRFNRRTQSRVMKTAGQSGERTSVIRHTGRTTGNSYETPIGVLETEDGLLITLPYGTSPDWLKNVRAAGSAELVHQGETFAVAHPELVRVADLDHTFSLKDRVVQRFYGVDLFLRLRKFDPATVDRG